MTGADRAIRGLATGAVTVLAVAAGAVSYTHMRLLAEPHGQAGWQVHAFPISVEGVEIVASLVLLADRRTGRRSGWLVWAALAAGTVASMAANVAVAAADPVGRVVSGWPAVALLIAIKLMSGLFDHTTTPPPSSRSVSEVRTADARSRTARAIGPQPTSERRGPAPPRPADSVANLMSTVRAIQAAVTADGTKLTRTVLREQLRQRGTTVSNARLSLALQHLAQPTDHLPPANARTLGDPG